MNSTLQQLQHEIAGSLHGLDASQTQLRLPSAHIEKWTIQQIIEHLLLTYSATTNTLESRVTKGTPTRATPSLPQRIAQEAVVRLGIFPSGRKAPSLVTPTAKSTPLTGEELTRSAARQLTQLDHACTQAGELFGTVQPCASHMVLGPLNVEQWRMFQLRHGRHHLKQIAAIRKAHNL